MTAVELAKTLDMPREEWKDVPGFEGLYKVSNYGRVYSCPRCGTKGGILTSSDRSLPPSRNVQGVAQ